MNKPYKSTLAPLLEQYLDYRRSIGFTSRSQRSLLRSFDEHMTSRKVDLCSLTPEFFLDFKHTLGTSASTRNQKISAVRSFFQFLSRKQIVLKNPLEDIPADKENAYVPYIFSLEQIQNLLRVLEKTIRRDESYFFLDLTVYTAILLIARCGLRRSEPTRLTMDDYNRREGSIYIEKTKFNKDRLIPVPNPCLAHLENYLNIRTEFVGKRENKYLLPGSDARKLCPNRIYSSFAQAIEILGGCQPRRSIANMTFGGPTPHSLRHSFAVNTLKSIKSKGRSPQEALPILSAYMGHRKYRYTAVYLKFMDAEQRSHLVDFSIGRQEEI